MLKEDKDFLKNLFADYTPQLVMRTLVEVVGEAADEASDNGLKDDAKNLTLFAKALEDITSGRPFLV
jgi:hypothetical protein